MGQRQIRMTQVIKKQKPLKDSVKTLNTKYLMTDVM